MVSVLLDSSGHRHGDIERVTPTNWSLHSSLPSGSCDRGTKPCVIARADSVSLTLTYSAYKIEDAASANLSLARPPTDFRLL